jgi:hypothetical protein
LTYRWDRELAQMCSQLKELFVTLLDVLEHQADDRAFLSELLDKMEPEAALIVTVPALMGLWSEWDVALGHRRRYDKASFRRCVTGLPVEVRELSYLFPEMIPWAGSASCKGAFSGWTQRPSGPSFPTCRGH